MKYGKFVMNMKVVSKDTTCEVTMSSDGFEIDANEVVVIAINNLKTFIALAKGFIKFQAQLKTHFKDWMVIIHECIKLEHPACNVCGLPKAEKYCGMDHTQKPTRED